VYSGTIEKDHLIIITALYANYLAMCMCISIISLISDKITKETFVEALNVVDKPLKVIN